MTTQQCSNPACGNLRGANRVVYARTICKTCYGRESRRGTLGNWPLTLRFRPPVAPPATVDLATFFPGEHIPWEGAWRAQAWRATVAYEQNRTAEWLAARGQTTA